MEKRLKELLNNAYAPYSKFRVSSIVEMKDGANFVGVNVENASYGATICAERTAILQAISNGYKKGDFKTLYLTTSSEDFVFPCNICRQVMVEFFENDTEIVLITGEKEKKYKFSELVTYTFSSEDLKWNQDLYH